MEAVYGYEPVEEKVPDTSEQAIRDRAIGALVGLAIGDAVGTTLEFKPRDSYPPRSDLVGGGPLSLASFHRHGRECSRRPSRRCPSWP